MTDTQPVADVSEREREGRRWELVRQWLADTYDPVGARDGKSLPAQLMEFAEAVEAAGMREAVAELRKYNQHLEDCGIRKWELHLWRTVEHDQCTCGLTETLDRLEGRDG